MNNSDTPRYMLTCYLRFRWDVSTFNLTFRDFIDLTRLRDRFAIIVPAVMTPAIITLFAADRRAKKNGELAFGASLNERRRLEKANGPVEARKPFLVQAKEIAIKMDLIGLVLIGFTFGLILFPISLAKTVRGGWSNRKPLNNHCVRSLMPNL